MSKQESKEFTGIAGEIEQYVGEPLAILCARYWYRGMVRKVGQDFVKLSDVRAVEVTGAATSLVPQTEDPVPSDMTISVGAIEQVCQPAWVWHEMPVSMPKEVKEVVEKLSKKKAERSR